jgi:DNA-binding GntR family transcriptional regulator
MADVNVTRTSRRNGADLPIILGHPTMKDLIHHALRERIVFGELRPGERLVEADLATRFQVSKTPVREALLTLEAEGLVTMRAHRGATVSELSPEQYRDLQFTRDALEFGAAREIVAAMTPARLAQAETHLAEMVAAFDADDYRSYRSAERNLHAVFLSAPGYPTLAKVGLNLQDCMDRYAWAATVGRRDRWLADLDAQRRRLELIRAGDPDALVEMLRRWHADGLEHLTRHLALGGLISEAGAENDDVD